MTQRERLLAILSETLRLPAADITSDLDMAGSGSWDSLSHMQLIAAIEDEFSLEVSADEIVTMTSVGSIEAVLRAHQIDI
jgi:acyl carrier protein